MNQDQTRRGVLRRIGDFALGPAAGLLGVLLLGGAVAHLLAPEASSPVAPPPLLVASSADVTRAVGALAVGKLGASGARPGVENQRVGMAVLPSRSPAAVRGSDLAVRHGNGRTAAVKAHAERPPGVAIDTSRVSGEKAVALRAPIVPRAATLRAGANLSTPATTGEAPARLPAPVADRVRNAVAARTGLPHTRSVKAYDRPAVYTAARVVLLPSDDLRAPTAEHGLTAGTRASSAARLPGWTSSSARKSHAPVHTARLQAPRAPLGYDERPVLARVPVAALPAAPIATTPVRGKTPAARTTVARDAADGLTHGVVLGPP